VPNPTQVISAAGPFSDEVRAMSDAGAPKMIMASSGVHVTLPDYYSPDHLGMIVPKTKARRRPAQTPARLSAVFVADAHDATSCASRSRLNSPVTRALMHLLCRSSALRSCWAVYVHAWHPAPTLPYPTPHPHVAPAGRASGVHAALVGGHHCWDNRCDPAPQRAWHMHPHASLELCQLRPSMDPGYLPGSSCVRQPSVLLQCPRPLLYYEPHTCKAHVRSSFALDCLVSSPPTDAAASCATDSSAEITMRPQPSEEEIGFILGSIAEYLTVKVCAMPLPFCPSCRRRHPARDSELLQRCFPPCLACRW